MANNRMYLKCMCCGEKLFLGKSFLAGYYTDGFVNETKLNDFYDEHSYCHKGKTGPFTDGDFILEYEDPYKCPTCNKPIDPIDEYCRHCGVKIPKE